MTGLRIIEGGIAAPLGFKAGGVKNLALIYSNVPCICAGIFTTNKITAAPVKLTSKRLKKAKGITQAIIANSGNANCSTGSKGLEDAKAMAKVAASGLGIDENLTLVASTGIIGKPFPIREIEKNIPYLIKTLSKQGSRNAAKAIMTTDTKPKEMAVRFKIKGRDVTIGGIAKGAGMISPNLATMLAFITTDACIEQKTLRKLLKIAADKSFNCITVDGCMSTNDTVLIMANGLANNPCIRKDSRFCDALTYVCSQLSKMIIEDAEGATKFIEVYVQGAKNYKQAKIAANTVANSNLVKSAVFGEDKNTGRVIAAIGASGIDVDGDRLKVDISPLKNKKVRIDIDIMMGKGKAYIWTSDLSTEYVRLNARYN